ncbi:Protein of unknown function [Lactobacillus helveticus CIRM-BIA 101]|nr:Protein of unknown function [Lactobacillus helveticus CIRM-BIA 101]
MIKHFYYLKQKDLHEYSTSKAGLHYRPFVSTLMLNGRIELPTFSLRGRRSTN